MLKVIQAGLVMTVVILWSSPTLADSEFDFIKGLDLYESGKLVEAEKWLRKAAKQGHVEAKNMLRTKFEDSPNGVGEIFNKALSHYKAKDYAAAVKLFRKIAHLELDVVQFNLGNMYGNSQGVPQDYAEAVKWWRKAADQGYAPAQFNLSVVYEDGRGVPQDYAEAVKWYRKAADQGYANSQFNLGVMYEDGRGVPQDYAEAVKWYRKAAEQWVAPAQDNLGRMYGNGQGVLQDYVLAHMWFNLAGANGNSGASKNRDKAAGHMTAAQIAEAQRRARVCMNSNYKKCD